MLSKWSLAFGLLLISPCMWCQQTSTRNTGNQHSQPNIILIIGDDIGADDIGCYGNKEVKTPNIDRIASEGLLFKNAFLSISSCSPSRSSIISGRYPHNTGAAELHTAMPPTIPLFPDELKKAGYYTAQAGKWHMGNAVKRAFNTLHLAHKPNGDGGEEKWIETLQNRPKDKPFFMWFASYDAHRPWGENSFKGQNDPDMISPPPYLANMEPTREDLASFYDEITRFDNFIGKVEEELKKEGVLDNTIIIIMGDNGRPFPRAKTRVYDSGMQTPLIVKWNKGTSRKGVQSESLLSSIDIAPTLLDIAGVKIPESFQGRSFAELFKNPELEFRKYVFSEHNWHDFEALERMLRTKDFLYVLNLRPNLRNTAPGITPSPSLLDLRKLRDSGKLTDSQNDVFLTPRPSEELFDLKKDSIQLMNVASVPAYTGNLEKMREVMNQWRKETVDPDPGELTKDWYDRETREVLPAKGTRGEMPGGREALHVNAGGPF